MNIDDNGAAITTISGTQLKHVDDFKYLGSYIADSKKDFLTRKGLAWSACQKLHKIWSSGISSNLKVKFFRACIEPILLYGSETWTMQKAFENRLDGCYTRFLMRIQNLSWKNHPTKKQIYGNLQPISSIVAERRARFAGHCSRAANQCISNILHLRLPQCKRGRRPLTFLDTVSRDTEIHIDDMRNAMGDRAVWRNVVNGVSTERRRK